MTATDYGDLSTTELVKQINDEYAAILADERTYLKKALSLGEKLIALRPRIAPDHGQWQAKLKLHCQAVSYEKANLCIRFVENFDKLEAYAASKNVKVTDLGIDEARKALAKPKSDPNESAAGKAAKAAVEPASEPPPPNGPPDQVVKDLELDDGDMFEVLKATYEQDDLMKLTQRLAQHLKMRLVPSDALNEVFGLAAE